MSRCLIDTSVLVRLANNSDPMKPIAKAAIDYLNQRFFEIYICPQNLVEFRNAVSQPIENNGLGLSAHLADEMIESLERLYLMLPETPKIFPLWKSLVSTHQVLGKQVHDARLAAVCWANGISHLLSFNVSHFMRFTTSASLTILAPRNLPESPTIH